MLLSEVKPMHCKMILNRMEDTYAGGTILQTYITMGSMFRAAVDNDLIRKHPMDGSPLLCADQGKDQYQIPDRR